MKIKSIKCTCSCCPSQWEGITDKNEAIYIRYRSGYLTIELSGELIHSEQIGGGLEGYISLEKVMDIIEREAL